MNIFFITLIIFDVGYSYTQIKDPKKGLAFESNGLLNMRMGINEFTASDVVNKLEQKDLELIFKFFGDEEKSKIISKKIVLERNRGLKKKKKLVRKKLRKYGMAIKRRRNLKQSILV